jgi:hypothetical protein
MESLDKSVDEVEPFEIKRWDRFAIIMVALTLCLVLGMIAMVLWVLF